LFITNKNGIAMSFKNSQNINRNWKTTLHEIIFEADTKPGKWFDVILILCIILSVFIVMLDSVASIKKEYGAFLNAVEWFFTILFTIEYILRLISVGRPTRYATSFFGIIDLLAILPTYVSIILPGSRFLTVIRIFRVMRIFRVLKLVQYLAEAKVLTQALHASRRKITVFLFAVFTLVIILGSLMYVIESEENGFTSIPRSIYWAIVTLTTVGYGDISPKTGLGQALAAVVMVIGYSIIAVPTGIITAEISRTKEKLISTQSCPDCSREGHDKDAIFCKHCGANL
jgi:voltage-gated potassium channel